MTIVNLISDIQGDKIVMKEYLLTLLIFGSFVFCQAEEPIIEVGFESVTEQEDGTYLLNVYAINKEPIAGVQFQLIPEGIFIVDSVYGGRCGDSEFMLKSNSKGVIIGFSMKGDVISSSVSDVKEENILLTVRARKVSVNARGISMDSIDLKSIFANRSAKKMEYVSYPFALIGKKEK